MSLQQALKEEIKTALKNRDEVRLSVVRGLVTAFTNELVAKGKKPDDFLTDDEVLTVIKRASKQRQDSIKQFRAGGREDLATKEETELAIIERYLPAQLTAVEIRTIARAKIAELGAVDKSKIGILIGTVLKETQGAADGATVKEIVQQLLLEP